MLLLAAFLMTLTTVFQTYPTVTEDDIISWIYDYAIYYDTSPEPVLAVARCESMYFSSAVINNRRLGSAGEVGTFQFHPRGIYRETPQYNAGYSVYDPEANVAAGVWAISQGFGPRHWVYCWRNRANYS